MKLILMKAVLISYVSYEDCLAELTEGCVEEPGTIRKNHARMAEIVPLD